MSLDGRIRYEREFLLSLQHTAATRECPENLPHMSCIRAKDSNDECAAPMAACSLQEQPDLGRTKTDWSPELCVSAPDVEVDRIYELRATSFIHKKPLSAIKVLQQIADELKEKADEEVDTILMDSRATFQNTIRDKISLEAMILFLNILSKMSDRDIKAAIIPIVCSVEFLNKLSLHITRVTTNDVCKDPVSMRSFFDDLMIFYDNILTLLPNTSCERLGSVLLVTDVVVKKLSSTSDTQLYEDIIGRLSELSDRLKVAMDARGKNVDHENAAAEALRIQGPPDNFRSISVYPDYYDIFKARKPFLRPAILKGRYESVDHYLDIQYRLLREDFLSPLRAGLEEYAADGCTNQNVRVYKEVYALKLEEQIKRKRGWTTEMRDIFLLSKDDNDVKDNDSKSLMRGSLVLLMSDDLRKPIIAEMKWKQCPLLKHNLRFMSSNPQVTLGSTDAYYSLFDAITFHYVEDVDERDFFRMNDFDDRNSFTLIESLVYFLPYGQVLRVLKEFTCEDFPMKKYIIDCQTKADPPQYLLNSPDKLYRIAGHSFPVLDDSKWPNAEQLSLNPSQYRAFKTALTQEFVIIQGPPGTGKTHVGLQIVQTLLANRASNGPMLVVCLTNHALDQFLEGILDFTEKITRIGGQCKNKSVERFVGRADIFELLEAEVIGMTTAGAARHHRLLETIDIQIVIVEEAAEILESHVIASLTSNCQHLIQIGDHQQLRPATNVYRLAKKYHLDVSLFERMLINGFHCETLNIQHRMRPEIAQLIVPAIYPKLTNHPSVMEQQNVRGIDKNVFFFTHNRMEEQDFEGTSHRNKYEARLIVALCSYLLLQGYEPRDITILATYVGQMTYIQELASVQTCWGTAGIALRDARLRKALPLVRVAVVDNYQGEENKIILLSLVRSNLQKNIGYLKIANRVCVALSRAKEGLYIVGNMPNLTSSSTIWPKIEQSLLDDNAIGTHMTLRCQNHPEQAAKVASAEDFVKVPEGGCLLPCATVMSCGHECQSVCHILQHPMCKTACPRHPESCEFKHPCRRACGESCDPCLHRVERTLQCGHIKVLPCYVNHNEHKCTEEVAIVIPHCLHEVKTMCHKKSSVKCNVGCAAKLSCGHACEANCHILEDHESLEVVCKAYLSRDLDSDWFDMHECSGECREEAFTTHHKAKGDCQHPCDKELPCGHATCTRKCGETCANRKCMIMVTKTFPNCGHETEEMNCWMIGTESGECIECKILKGHHSSG